MSADGRRARVAAVSASPVHAFSKEPRDLIRLVAGRGVEGDAHFGERVQHRSRVARDPSQPNLRQVHLIPAELHEELAASGFTVAPGDLGENVTTLGLDLLSLPTGTRLHLGDHARVELTGLRNPCAQIDRFSPGLLGAVLGRTEAGELVRRAGVMAIVIADGTVRPGDEIALRLPPPPHRAMRVV